MNTFFQFIKWCGRNLWDMAIDTIYGIANIGKRSVDSMYDDTSGTFLFWIIISVFISLVITLISTVMKVPNDVIITRLQIVNAIWFLALIISGILAIFRAFKEDQQALIDALSKKDD